MEKIFLIIRLKYGIYTLLNTILNHISNLTKKLKIIIDVYTELINNIFIFKSLKFLKNRKYDLLVIVFITTK